MKTKFDIGDQVFMTGEVTHISVYRDDVVYLITINGMGNREFRFSERELMLKKKAGAGDGNKIG